MFDIRAAYEQSAFERKGLFFKFETLLQDGIVLRRKHKAGELTARAVARYEYIVEVEVVFFCVFPNPLERVVKVSHARGVFEFGAEPVVGADDKEPEIGKRLVKTASPIFISRDPASAVHVEEHGQFFAVAGRVVYVEHARFGIRRIVNYVFFRLYLMERLYAVCHHVFERVVKVESYFCYIHDYLLYLTCPPRKVAFTL